MNDPVLEWAIELQSIAQAGLQYGHDTFDLERYRRLRDIATEMVAHRTDVPLGTVRDVFCCEEGYQTPKVDTRAAIFSDGKILLVHENNGMWALPGGWCDVDQSIASNTVKEAREETGLTVTAERLIAVQDWRRHNVTNYAFGILKAFVQCGVVGGSFEQNSETTEARYFARDELPENLAVEKTTREQVLLCFEAHDAPQWETRFD